MPQPSEPPRVIILNGGSSSGKSTIARALQARLPDPWLAFGVDDLIDAMPERMRPPEPGDPCEVVLGAGEAAGADRIVFTFTEDGGIELGNTFAELEAAYRAGLAAMVRAGARMIVDDVFLGGAGSQARTRHAFDGLPVLWAGVHCDVEAAAARERARLDRPLGMAASQAALVHRGVTYDVEVDTTSATPGECADVIAARLRNW